MGFSVELIQQNLGPFWSASITSRHGSIAMEDLVGRAVSIQQIQKMWNNRAPSYSPLIQAVRQVLKTKGVWPVWKDSHVGEAGGQLIQTIIRSFPKTYSPPANKETADAWSGKILEKAQAFLSKLAEEIKDKMTEKKEEREQQKQQRIAGRSQGKSLLDDMAAVRKRAAEQIKSNMESMSGVETKDDGWF